MKLEVIEITDRSGSMISIDHAVCNGINSFVDSLREDGNEVRYTRVLFDDRYELKFQAAPLHTVERLATVGPRGNTLMRYAIVRTLEEQGKRIAHEGWADLVQVVIATDGRENPGNSIDSIRKSRENSVEKVNAMISHAKKHGWQFIYMGANHDAEATAEAYGIGAAHTVSFQSTAASTTTAYSQAALRARQLRNITF